MGEPHYPDAPILDSFQNGLEFQDFVCQQLAQRGIILQNFGSKRYQYEVGENLQGFEIKHDSWCSKSKRLSIEIAERTRNDEALGWTPSGIMRCDNTWLYIQGNRQILFVFAKNFLRRYYTAMQDKEMLEIQTKHGTVRTFYLSFEVARKHAARVLEFA